VVLSPVIAQIVKASESAVDTFVKVDVQATLVSSLKFKVVEQAVKGFSPVSMENCVVGKGTASAFIEWNK
jgi:hypothetical protein